MSSVPFALGERGSCLQLVAPRACLTESQIYNHGKGETGADADADADTDADADIDTPQTQTQTKTQYRRDRDRTDGSRQTDSNREPESQSLIQRSEGCRGGCGV
eukprot:1461776-Rhodomonas_salina.2